jgi:hypothetical protein
MRLAEKLGWSLLSSALLMIVAAFASNRTGKHALTTTGDMINTHAPATWVLGTLGLVLLINAVVLFAWVNEQKAQARDEPPS